MNHVLMDVNDNSLLVNVGTTKMMAICTIQPKHPSDIIFDGHLIMSPSLNTWKLIFQLTISGGNTYKESWTQDGESTTNLKPPCRKGIVLQTSK